MNPPTPPRKPNGPPGPPAAKTPPQRAAKIEGIFHSARALPKQEREAHVVEACGGNASLQAEVMLLLASVEGAWDLVGGAASSPEIEAEMARLKPEEPGEQIGRYKLREQIGEGGFGTVWVAEQEEPVRRRVALKIIKLGMDTKEVIARFEQERQALALMDHPGIAKVFDAGATEWGRPFFVMELVRGIRITDYCDQANLPTAERLELFIAVCNAVQHAHQKGIIHRDLKPSNILVTLHDGAPVPKVIDFGVAKATQGRLTDRTIYTQFQQMIGTPLYMSPEQAEMTGLDVDTRSDIYSLGVLLYELLTGRTPVDAETLLRHGLDEIRRIIREQELPKPSTALKTMPLDARTIVAKHRQTEPPKLVGLLRGDLDWIVMKSLEKDRTRRYQTASAFAADILHQLADEPVSAGAPSAAYRFRKFARRHKTALAGGVTIVTTLVAATVASTQQAIRASRAEGRATQRLAEVAAERDAKDKAREEAEAISAFLIEVFRSPDASQDGRAITVAETLDTAVKQIETDLTAQPELQVKLQSTIGRTYEALGLARDAIPLLEKARNYFQITYGAEHPDTFKLMGSLATAYADAGQKTDALKLQEDVLTVSRKVLGSEDRYTLGASRILANSYLSTARKGEGLTMLEEVVAISRGVLGPEDRHTLLALHMLAHAYGSGGRADDELKLHEQLLPLSRKVNGTAHPETLREMGCLAVCFDKVDRRKEALELREELLPVRRKLNGPEHPVTLTAMHYLADSYSAAGRGEEAFFLREELLTLRRKVNGPEDPLTLTVMHNLGLSYSETGRREEALKLREKLLPLYRKVNGPEDSATLLGMHYLADSYGAAGRKDEAFKLREELLSLRRKLNGPENPLTLTVMHNLALSYLETGRPDEALKLREALLLLRRKVNGPETDATLGTMQTVADSYAAAARGEEALKLREELLLLRRKVNGLDNDATIRVMRNLGDSYIAVGRVDEGLRLLAEASALRPKDSLAVLRLAALTAWFGNGADHLTACRTAMEMAVNTDIPEAAERAAKGFCLLPSSDSKQLEMALSLARRAVELGKNKPFVPHFQLALGMAEYRSSHYTAAEQALKGTQQAAKNLALVYGGTAGFYLAMSLAQ